MDKIADIIYSASLDDEAFSCLPKLLNKIFDARSCSILWTDASEKNNIFLHSGYYDQKNLDDYFLNFSQHDLWIAEASAPQRLNLAWLSSQAIAHDTYASSIFYNEWIRPMGDDTSHALGSSMLTAQGSGIIGLHRGRSQGDFDPLSTAQLNDVAVHLRRMLTFRSRLAAAEMRAAQFQQGFIHSPGAVLIVDHNLRIRLRNDAAERLLRQGDVLSERMAHLGACRALHLAGFENVIRSAARSAAPQAGTCCMREERGGLWKISAMPLVTGTFAGCAMLQIEVSEPAVEVLVVSPRLQSLYGLTPAEALVAVAIANGQSVGEIAQARGSSEETVRSQLKACMAKMAVHRQSEIAAIVTRLR